MGTMLQGVSDIASHPDPTGTITYAHTLDNNLDLYRVFCLIGVLLWSSSSRVPK
jgi:glutamate-5-semialdehyde dehydrogenase